MNNVSVITRASFIGILFCFYGGWSLANGLDGLEQGKLDWTNRMKAIALVGGLRDWLLEPVGNERICVEGKCYSVRNGFLRKEMIVIGAENGEKNDVYRSEVLSSKICHAMRFLVRAGQSESVKYDARSDLRELGDLLIDRFQYTEYSDQANRVLVGGFEVSETESAMTSQGSALCGLALVESWEYLESWAKSGPRNANHKFIRSAKLVANFLETMHNPSRYKYLDSFRFNKNGVENKQVGAFLDEVRPFCLNHHCSESQRNFKFVITSTSWNALAFAFLYRIDNIQEISAQTSYGWRQTKFYTDLVRNGYEGVDLAYRVNSSQQKYILVNGFLGKSQESNSKKDRYRNRWGFLIGSDMPEYVINSLKIINNKAGTKEIFNKYNNAMSMTKKDGQWFVIDKTEYKKRKLDPVIGWGGFFLVGGVDGQTNIYNKSKGRDVYHQHDHYDFDAITAEAKSEFVPCEIQGGIARLLKDHSLIRPELLDESLENLSWFPSAPRYKMKSSHWLYSLLGLDLLPYKPTKSTLSSKELKFVNENAGGVNWTVDEKVYKYSKGASTVAHNATLLLRALEFSQDSSKSCPIS